MIREAIEILGAYWPLWVVPVLAFVAWMIVGAVREPARDIEEPKK